MITIDSRFSEKLDLRYIEFDKDSWTLSSHTPYPTRTPASPHSPSSSPSSLPTLTSLHTISQIAPSQSHNPQPCLPLHLPDHYGRTFPTAAAH
ncbi:hypothetical protein E2C01_006417 [Portunus trituberculatus]|uniref:Uncharacterized protein n=1 Tax=Portunus trituberculatus TaxID=210409 RepID=A0A5B7D1S3_PORTR|nr:hypothetical protein [Portunus trituberculatus]